MIGRVIDECLTDEERGVYLTARLGEAPELRNKAKDCRCFYGALIHFLPAPATAVMMRPRALALPERCARINNRTVRTHDGWWFDALCRRFGDARIANAIRNRVLSPRSRTERIAARRSRVAVVSPPESAHA